MRLKELFLVTAVVEVATGLALLGLPAVVLASLLGIQAAVEETLVVEPVAGAALLAIGVTSALARDDARSPAQRGVLVGILTYDVLVALLLVYSRARRADGRAGAVAGRGVAHAPHHLVHPLPAGLTAARPGELLALTRRALKGDHL